MKSTNTFGVHFSLSMNRRVNGKFPIYVRITVNKSRCVVALKTLVNEEDWNMGKGSPKPKNEELKQLASYLEEVRSKIVVHFQRLQLENTIVTAEAVKNSYLGLNEKPAPEKWTLCKLMDMHNDLMKTLLENGTLKKHFSTAAYIKRYLSLKYQVRDINLEDLNYAFINNCSKYLSA